MNAPALLALAAFPAAPVSPPQDQVPQDLVPQDQVNGARPYELPEGFRVEPAAEAAASFIALFFDPEGRALVSREDGGLAWFEDRDGDGFFESEGEYTDRIGACQGMAWKDEHLYAVGEVEGTFGLHRLFPSPSGRAVRDVELVAEVVGSQGEHGPHGVVLGPDGMFYMTVGDHVRMAGEPGGAFPLLSEQAAQRVPFEQGLRDPNGHGHGVTYPGGAIVRIDPATGVFEYHSVGYRNAYDLDFDADGELFTYDSDMEWDVGLPWYRPTRFVQCVPGGDYGWRRGSGVWPAYYFDVVPPVLEAGRGSPTGVEFCDSAAFPQRYRGAFFAGDWTDGEILAFFPAAAGAGHTATVETVVRTDAGLPITDLAFGPNGDLYFVSGGRGTVGRFERLTYDGEVEPPSLRPARQATWLGRAVTPGMLASPDPVVVRRALESLLYAPVLPPDLGQQAIFLLGHADPWVRFAAYQLVSKHDLAIEGGAAGTERLPAGARLLYGAATLGARPRWTPPHELSIEADQLLDFLRTQQVLLRSEDMTSEGIDPATLVPHADRRVAREAALLFAVERPEGWVEALLAALESEQDREQQIHYAYCLTLEGGSGPASEWTDDQARKLLRWFDQAETWTGGSSFGGYLAAMRARLTARFDGEERLRLALEAPKKLRLGLRSVAQLTSGLEPARVDELVPAIQYGWAEARDEDRVAALRELAPTTSAPLLAFLRRQADNPDAPREAVLTALARSGDAEDWARFVEGLGAKSRDTAAACAEALAGLERVPDVSEPFREALDLARSHGLRQGQPFVRLFAHWSGEALPAPLPDEQAAWDALLGNLERWGTQAFPEFRREEVDDSRRPSWSFEETLAFLRASAARPGSPERGELVFRKATCASCHVVGERAWPELVGFGPDLAGVTSRFPLGELLETLWFPSAAIAQQYRTSVATTSLGLRFEGRVIADDGEVLTLKKADGTPVTLEWPLIESLVESELSTMPEGLLSMLTLEEVKDLLAFMAADGAAPGLAIEWIPLFDDDARNLWEGDEDLWKIRGGVLVGRTREPLEHTSYLVSKVRFDDFELELDVRFTDGVGNGGVQYRSSVRTGASGRPDPLGYQADLGDVHWGELFATDGRGRLAGPEDERWREVVDRDGWNHLYLRAQGDRHVIEVNGRTLVDVRDAAFTYGVLAFQLHAGEAAEIRHANARIRAFH